MKTRAGKVTIVAEVSLYMRVVINGVSLDSKMLSEFEWSVKVSFVGGSSLVHVPCLKTVVGCSYCGRWPA